MSSKTFIVLKPDALERGLVDQVMQRFFQHGFQVEHIHYRMIDETLIRSHYKDVILREGPEFVAWLDKEFVGKPALALILSYAEDDAIQFVRDLLGNRKPSMAKKGTIRGDLGIHLEDPNAPAMNLIHASDSLESYEIEKRLWFSEI